MSELQDVIDAVKAIQATVSTPPGEKAIKEFYDEPPLAVATYPAFLNIEDFDEPITFVSSHRHIVMTIRMHLLFAPFDQRYSIRSRRRWVKPVIDAFGAKIQLNGTVVRSSIDQIDYDPVTLFEKTYHAATFVLRADMSDTFAASA